MENINVDSIRAIMKDARKKPSTREIYKKIISKAIISAAKNGRGEVFVETNGELSQADRNYFTDTLVKNGLKVKWHDIGDYDDEKIHIMWEERFYGK